MDNKTVIIVYPKKRAEFAHLLAQLISAYTEVEVVEWEEKHWESNKPTLTSSQKIIFLGSVGNSYSIGIKWVYNEHSMKYGWLANHCILDVEMIGFGKVKKFKTHYQERSGHFTHIAESAKGRDIGFGWVAILDLCFIFPIFISERLAEREKLKKYQYQLLICEFVLEGGFKQFMEA